jgi:hypothetical protein
MDFTDIGGIEGVAIGRFVGRWRQAGGCSLHRRHLDKCRQWGYMDGTNGGGESELVGYRLVVRWNQAGGRRRHLRKHLDECR